MAQSNSSLPNYKFRLYLGSALLFVGMVVLTFVFAPLVLVCALLPFSVRYKVARCWVGLVLKMAKIFCGISYEVEGLEHIKPDRPAVILSNHQSAWETLAFRYFLPPQTSLFKESLLWIPLWGWAMATLKPIAINRKNKHASLRKLISRGTDALKEGLWVVVFPEGTRMPVGEMRSFSAGGAMLAQKSGNPVVPIAHNAGKCWARYSFLKYPGTIKVKIGPYIETNGRKAEEINKEAEQWVIQAMQEINR